VSLLRKETRLRWTQPAWREEAETWIRAALADTGRTVAAIEHPHVRPWGTAMRVSTNAGVLWFKASIEQLAHEVPLLRILGRQRPGSVPELLAGDDRRGWMLVADSGVRLVDLHPDGVPLPVWRRLLRAYAQLQLDTAPAADELVAAGVPDRRSGLVDGFERVVAAASTTRDEQGRLRSLLPAIRDAVDAVAALGLPDTVQHDDLHPWNVCVSDGGFRFIDWGDACIAQPLTSLGVPLAYVAPADADAARDSYLQPWTALRPQNELLAACDAARLLSHVTALLKWELINSGLTADEVGPYGDVIEKRLRHLLEVECA
jgi:hypothetical protein